MPDKVLSIILYCFMVASRKAVFSLLQKKIEIILENSISKYKINCQNYSLKNLQFLNKYRLNQSQKDPAKFSVGLPWAKRQV